MKTKNTKPYFFHNSLILRSPRMPFQFNFTKETLWQSLHSGFLEPLYLASPNLTRKLRHLAGEHDDSLILSLIKYFTRAAFRCTPFGLFAGCSAVQWGDTSHITFSNEHKHTRLDMHYVHALAGYLTNHKDIINYILFYPNNTIYELGNKLRYIEYSMVKSKRHYSISEVECTKEIKQVLNIACNGATVRKLIQPLLDEGYRQKEAVSFIHSLRESRLLISELEPGVTGKEYLSRLMEFFEGIEKTNKVKYIVNTLQTVAGLLEKISKKTLNNTTRYEEIIGLLTGLEVPLDEGKIFQTDLIKPVKNATLSHNIKKLLEEGVEALLYLAPDDANERLSAFAGRFYERYGDEEMPLLQVLDTETGIGYPAPLKGIPSSLIDNLDIPGKNSVSGHWTKIDELLLDKLQQALFSNSYEIHLSKADLAEFEPKQHLLPPSFSVMFRVIDFKENKVYIESAGGPSAVTLLGRFAHADSQLNRVVMDIARAEEQQNPGVVFAEIVHISENRTGNVLLHPAFRKYEIPVLAKSSVSSKQQIPLNDLFISVKGGHICLRSGRLNKKVVPRLSNAHNYLLSELPVYSFLCDMQTHEITGNLSFSWGSRAGQYLFLPRVVYGKAVLHPATWQLPEKEWEHLLKKQGDELLQAMASFSEKWKMPRYLVLAQGDNELFVDVENELTLLAFLDTIKKFKKIRVKEFLFDHATPIHDTKGNPYMNQFVAPVIRASPAYKKDIFPAISSKKVKREFPPGTEWVYYKYYCGTAVADAFLTETIKPLTRQFLKKGWIDSWFFIRYKDNGPNLRVRYHCTDIKYIKDIIRLNGDFTKKYLGTGLIWDICLDTYKREIERYEADTIAHAEKLFFFDSTAIVDFLSKTDGAENENTRWLWGMKAVDELMDCFKVPLEDKLILMDQLQDAFKKEFNIEKPAKLQIDKKYRQYRQDIEQLFGSRSNGHFREFTGIVDTRSKNILPVASEIMDKKDKNTIQNLLRSYIHMHLNRLFPHSQRLHEMVLYDFMYRYYKSERARTSR